MIVARTTAEVSTLKHVSSGSRKFVAGGSVSFFPAAMTANADGWRHD
jgi:hypothetical protein